MAVLAHSACARVRRSEEQQFQVACTGLHSSVKRTVNTVHQYFSDTEFPYAAGTEMAAEATILTDSELGGSISVSKPGPERVDALTLRNIEEGSQNHSLDYDFPLRL